MTDQILTEEELKEMNFGLLIEELRAEGCNFGVGKIEKLIASHRHLFTANAELSFKNQKLKESLTKVKDHLEGVMNPRRFVILDGPGMLQTLNLALEETK